jgi:hypothetical protein
MATLEFAGLVDGDTMPPEAFDKDGQQQPETFDDRLLPSQIRTEPKTATEAAQPRRTGMTTLSFQVSEDRLVEVAVQGGPLTKNELGILKEYLTTQEKVAPTTHEPEAVAEREPSPA